MKDLNKPTKAHKYKLILPNQRSVRPVFSCETKPKTEKAQSHKTRPRVKTNEYS